MALICRGGGLNSYVDVCVRKGYRIGTSKNGDGEQDAVYIRGTEVKTWFANL
jgi:hypothetical protein